jgi:hypothetical protein
MFTMRKSGYPCGIGKDVLPENKCIVQRMKESEIDKVCY